MALKQEKSSCLICSQSIADVITTDTEPENGPPTCFEFLCELFGLHSAFRQPSLFGTVESSDLCSNCRDVISDGLTIRQQIQALQTKLEVLRDGLKNQILSTYIKEDEFSGDTIKPPKPKKLFAQCLGTCCVVIPRIPDRKKCLPRARRNLRKRKQQDFDFSKGQPCFERKGVVSVKCKESILDDDTLDPNPAYEGVKSEESCPDDDEADNVDDDSFEPPTKQPRKASENSILPPRRSQKVKRKYGCKKDGVLISFECKTCKQEFKREHYKTPDDSYLFRCELEKCPRVYRDFHKFRRHHGLNCPERPMPTMVICEQCGASFCTAVALGHHVIRSHTKEFPYFCDQCGAGCVTNAALQVHMLRHTGEKKFKCEQCGSSFKRRDQLDVHVRRHTNERPFVCSLCGKGFGSRQHMQTHEKGHSSEKTIKCPHCERMFVSKHQVRNHVYSAHKEFRKKKTTILREDSKTAVQSTNSVQVRSSLSTLDGQQNEEVSRSYISPENSFLPETNPAEEISESRQGNDSTGSVG